MPQAATIRTVQKMKQDGRKIVAITAYDYSMALWIDQAGVDIVLVGDSLGSTMLGYESTIPVEMSDMIRAVQSVQRATKKALLIADMPFGSYGADVWESVQNAAALMKSGADGVKVEGAACIPAIQAMVDIGIPVMGHLGFTPQSVHRLGGHKVQGRGEDGQRLLESARALQDAGCFSIVLELVPSNLAAEVSAALAIPTIGIGAGPGCDGQIQVAHDIVGLTPTKYKHARRFAELGEALKNAVQEYAEEAQNGTFPSEDESFE